MDATYSRARHSNSQHLWFVDKLTLSKHQSDTVGHYNVDFLIWAHDTAKLAEFAKEYNHRRNMQYKLVVHPDWKIKFIKGDNSRGNDQTNFIAPNVRLIDSWTYLSRRSTFVDVYAMYGPVEGSRHVTAPTMVQIFDIEYEYIETPFEWISPLQVCYLEGIKTLCPNRGSEILNEIYKQNLREPNHYFDSLTGCWQPIFG